MNDLIKITYDNDRPTVSGRDLHCFLRVDTPYTIWFPRMCEYGFSDGVDYVTILLDKPEGRKGKPKTDHQITIEMAKELCMLQRNEKGKQARQHFIELEKKWNSPEQVMARALKLADQKIGALQEKNSQLEMVIQEQKPQVLFARSVTAADNSILIGNLAKVLTQNGYKVGQNRLYALLRAEGYLCSRKGDQWNMPTQKSMEMGLFEVDEDVYVSKRGVTYPSFTTKVTGKGQIYFINKYCYKQQVM